MNETWYIGRCDCGSVLDRPFSEQERIAKWKLAHLTANHVLTEDRTYEKTIGQSAD